MRRQGTREGPKLFVRVLEKVPTKPTIGRLSLRVAANTGTEFLRSTTLHGFKYFTDPHVAERLFWLVVHSVNACCASVLCAVLWQRFLQNPSILAVQPPAGPQAPVEPYPALTVCPPIRVFPAVANRFVAKLSLPPGLEVPYLVRTVPQLAAVFSPGFIFRKQQDLFMLDLVLSSNNLTYREALDKLTPTCDELLFRCSWRGNLMPCGKLFRRVIARSGICCGFNRPSEAVRYHTSSDTEATMTLWATDEQNSEDSMMASTAGLNLVINTSVHAVINTAVDCAKFKLEDISLESRKSGYTVVLPGNEYWAGAARVRVESNDDGTELALVNCDPSRANPYRRLSCLMDCVVRVMVARCGCVGPTYPQAPGNQPCAPSRLPCLIAIKDDLVMRDGSCNCLPPCDESRVTTEVESMRMSALEFTHDTFYRGVDERNVVVRTYLAHRRHRFYSLEPTVNWLTLLSSLGGVFNMFLGVGIISLMEVLFFMAVRLPLNALRAHRARRL